MKIQLKRSNIENKAPTPEQMAFGELAVNYNDNAPCIYLKKEDGSIVKIAGASSVGTGSGDITLTAGEGLDGGGTFNLADQTDTTLTLDVDLAADKGLAFHSSELGLVDGNTSGDVLRWTGTTWAPAQQDNDDTTYTLSDEAITGGGQINLDGSDGSQESFTIVGSGDTTVTHADGGITISSTNTAEPSDAEITIANSNGDAIDSFTLNQSADKTITLPAGTTDTNTTYTFTAIGDADPNTSTLRLTAGGDGTGDQDIALVGAGGLVITQVDENTLTFTQGDATGGTQDLQSVTDEGSTTTNGATFGDDVTVGDDPTTGETANGLMFRASGGVIARRAGATDNVFAGFQSGNASETSIITADGSATFADSVNVMGADPLNRVNLTASTGEIFCATDKTDATAMIRVQGGRGSSNETDNVVLNANGSATFAGQITATEFNPGTTGAGNFRIDLLPNISTAPKA